MSQIFSQDPVWSQTTKSGFRQQVFVMYHSTKPHLVREILNEGFKISQRFNLMLDDGLYVSRDIGKTFTYGPVCFKLLVYPGKSIMITEYDDPMRREWHRNFSSAWIPQNSFDYFHHNNYEETCVKSSTQVRILGIAYGHELLSYDLRQQLPNLYGTGDSLNRTENKILDSMLEQLGIIYSSFVHDESSLFLECSRSTDCVRVNDWTGRDNQLWTRTWDNCLENKGNGLVLVPGDDYSLDSPLMVEPVDAAGEKNQKWRLDNRGRFLHKDSNEYLCVDTTRRRMEDQLELRCYNFAKNDHWRFRCMGNTRTTDSFVHFTPWQEMVSWN
uniref:Ricin B lectin domain-containing protein n=1 Tax=Clytia hemisphaerica TaxID=252671 RepID=A0A7M5X565_9CNID